MPRDRESAKRAQSAKAAARARRQRAQLIRRIQWSVLGLAFLAVVGFALFRSTGGGGVAVSGQAALGSPAPEVEMMDFEGNAVTLSQYEGKPVVLNFWASWCPNCVAEMPDFERVFQSLGGEVEFIGVNQSDNRGAAEDLMAETGVTYTLTEDPNGAIFRAFGGAGMPTTAFIDAQGNVVDVVTGQLSEQALRDKIESSFGPI